MAYDWIWSSFGDLGMVVLSAIGVYLAVIIATRLSGLRSFARFSSFDFAVTIAIGSLLSVSLLHEAPPLANALVGLATLFILQRFFAFLRRFRWLNRLIDNTPVVLVKDGELIPENLKKKRPSPTMTCARFFVETAFGVYRWCERSSWKLPETSQFSHIRSRLQRKSSSIHGSLKTSLGRSGLTIGIHTFDHGSERCTMGRNLKLKNKTKSFDPLELSEYFREPSISKKYFYCPHRWLFCRRLWRR